MGFRDLLKSIGRPDPDLLRSIYSMSWPQLCTLMTQFVIGFTDIWSAGQIGTDTQASVGLITQCQVMLMVVCWATNSGAVAAVSQSLGAGKILRAQRFVSAVLWFVISSGLCLTVAGLVLHEHILHWLGTPETMMGPAGVFLLASLCSLPGFYAMAVCTALLRSAKSVMPALYTGIAVCLFNMVGDLGFGLGWFGFPKYGTAGLAWSTTVSVSFGGAVLFASLRASGLWNTSVRTPWCWVRHAMKYLLKVSVPAAVTSLLWNSAYLVIFMIVAALPVHPAAALAGMTAGLRIESLLFMPANAGNMTASVLVGHALGQGSQKRAMQVALCILLFLCAAMSCLGVVFWFLRDFFAVLMSSDPDTQAAIVSYLTYNILAVPFTVGTVVLSGVFAGAGATIYPMRSFIVSIWCIRVPMALVLGHWVLGYEGVFMSMLVSQFVQFCVLFWTLTHIKWYSHALRRGGEKDVL